VDISQSSYPCSFIYIYSCIIFKSSLFLLLGERPERGILQEKGTPTDNTAVKSVTVRNDRSVQACQGSICLALLVYLHWWQGQNSWRGTCPICIFAAQKKCCTCLRITQIETHLLRCNIVPSYWLFESHIFHLVAIRTVLFTFTAIFAK
jgi:hypothetical protein